MTDSKDDFRPVVKLTDRRLEALRILRKLGRVDCALFARHLWPEGTKDAHVDRMHGYRRRAGVFLHQLMADGLVRQERTGKFTYNYMLSEAGRKALEGEERVGR